MKTLYAAIISLILVFTIAAQDTSRVREADRLGSEVVSLFKEKNFKEALPIALKVVELEENEQGDNQKQIAQALRNLGYIYLYLDQEKEAENTFQRSIKIFEKIPNLDAESNKLAGNILESLALVKYRGKKMSDTEELFKKAASFYEKNGDLYWLETAKIWFVLGNLKTSQKDYAEAGQYYEKSLALRLKKADERDTDTVDALNRSICSYKKADKEKEIERVKIRYYPDGKFSENGTLKSKRDSESEKKTEIEKKEKAETEKKEKTEIDKNSIAGIPLIEPLESGVINGKAFSLPIPSYPYGARLAGASGTVKVNVVISETGEVLFACGAFSKTHSLLIESAEAAAYGAKFRPTTLDGNPVKVTGVIIYNFNR